MAIQDTTELNYTKQKALSGAGYLDSKYARGLKVHSVLSASTKGLPLGILDQYVWAREVEEWGKAEPRKKRSTAEKESQRWLDALSKSEELIPESTKVVTITDREGDFYDFMKCPRRLNSEFLIRASQNRFLESGKKLWSYRIRLYSICICM
ncbi:hypothetical protein [Okeania sp.]|uniref:hypothetical protein n=1 Tax=Okeania sp. TaxID=3100323 RepID=UPI002B4B64A3|nr:hypothetical protein [Okeania sp.]MEB3340985.1 hypothetical protein [Okeania sp.]